MKKEEREKLDKGIKIGEKAVVEIIKNGVNKAMNEIN